MEELCSYKADNSHYFVGSGWPKSIQENSQFLPLAKPGAESVAALAKNELETGSSFDPELANPVYLKTPEYHKK